MVGTIKSQIFALGLPMVSFRWGWGSWDNLAFCRNRISRSSLNINLLGQDGWTRWLQCLRSFIMLCLMWRLSLEESAFFKHSSYLDKLVLASSAGLKKKNRAKQNTGFLVKMVGNLLSFWLGSNSSAFIQLLRELTKLKVKGKILKMMFIAMTSL